MRVILETGGTPVIFVSVFGPVRPIARAFEMGAAG